MKRKIFIFTLLLMVTFGGCLVKSLHPFYKESDVEFREALIGTWTDSEGNTWEFTQAEEPTSFMGEPKMKDAYRVILKDSDSTEQDSYFILTLFQLNSLYFFNFEPMREENIGDSFGALHFVPGHSVARVHFFGDWNVLFHWYDEDWLNTLFEENRVKISHEIIEPFGYSEKSYILTASTEELQKFLVKFGPETDIFSKINYGSIPVEEEPAEIQKSIDFLLEEVEDAFMGMTPVLVNMRKTHE